MEPHGRSPASVVRHPDPGTGLEDSMWNLGLGGGGGGGGLPYPERPGEPDCSYYMRTGLCGYGERCRFNHPRHTSKVTGAARTAAAENPEPGGQPACLYFLKNGICKYGSTCKYDHRIQGIGSVHPVSFNYLGYPLRPGEKECSYYMRMGQCKFGPTCRFHHPQPPGASMPLSAPAYYPMMQYPSVSSPHHYQTFDAMRPSVVPAPYIQGNYGPMILSPGVVPFVGWSPYPPPASSVVSPGGQHNIQEGSLYGSSNQLSLSAPAYPGPYPMTSSSARPSSNSQKELMFPERPGQPECQYYMRTGHCKFGSACKYHHPPERSMPENNLSSIGLPLRPGAPHCAFYSQHGKCKFGSACKFDHPMGTLSYSPSASSLPDMPIAPYPIGSPLTALAPSSSSSALSSEFSSSNSISMDRGSRISSSS